MTFGPSSCSSARNGWLSQPKWLSNTAPHLSHLTRLQNTSQIKLGPEHDEAALGCSLSGNNGGFPGSQGRVERFGVRNVRRPPFGACSHLGRGPRLVISIGSSWLAKAQLTACALNLQLRGLFIQRNGLLVGSFKRALGRLFRRLSVDRKSLGHR